MKKLDFTPKNVINCVDNESTLLDTEFTDVHPEIMHVSTHIIGFHFWKHCDIIFVSVSDILFNPCGAFPFLRLGRYHCGT